jgi:hypothetical protein
MRRTGTCWLAVVGLLQLCAALPGSALAAPANDAFANAQQLPSSAPISVPGNNDGATYEGGETRNHSIYQDVDDGSVWFAWTAPRTARFRVGTCGSTGQTDVLVTTGSSLAGVNYEYERSTLDDDGCARDQNGNVFYFNASQGRTYRFQVVGHTQSGLGGAFQLTLEERRVLIFDGSISQSANRSRVPRGGTVTYTVTLRNSGDKPFDAVWVHLFASAPGREAVPAKRLNYVSFESTRGSCHHQTYFSEHKGVMCAIGPLNPGQQAVITAKVRLRQSITHWASLDYRPGTGEPIFDDNERNDERNVLTRVKP